MSHNKKKDDKDMRYFALILILLGLVACAAAELEQCQSDCIEVKCHNRFTREADFREICVPTCNQSCNLSKY